MKTIQHSYSPAYRNTASINSVWAQFMKWCLSQEKYRFGWLAAIVAGHGCVLTPITLFFIMTAGNSPVAWGFAMAAMTMSLVSNLAALPTKITIPVFFFSLVIDAAIILSCVL